MMCLCCADRLLRQFEHNHLGWFCPSCRQIMPGVPSALDRSPGCLSHQLVNYQGRD